GSVDIRLAGEHAGVVNQVARGEIVGAVNDHVVLPEELKRVGAAKPGVVTDDVNEWVNRLELVFGGVELLAANVGGGVDDLPLQVGVVDDVEIDDTERTHACSAEIKRERRAEAAGSDAEHLRGLELELALHADLGHDQVARVAKDLVVGERNRLGRGLSESSH